MNDLVSRSSECALRVRELCPGAKAVNASKGRVFETEMSFDRFLNDHSSSFQKQRTVSIRFLWDMTLRQDPIILSIELITQKNGFLNRSATKTPKLTSA